MRTRTWIALFRGINVGGHRILPMKELVAELEGLGLSGVRTYIQSGNAVFRSGGKASALAGRIKAAVAAGHGFEPTVIVLSFEELRAAASANPFPVDAESKTVHLCFLAEPPAAPDLAAMDAAKAAGEEYALQKTVLYLHTPGGLGNSKLAATVERSLGVPATARNWRSVNKILEIGAQVEKER